MRFLICAAALAAIVRFSDSVAQEAETPDVVVAFEKAVTALRDQGGDAAAIETLLTFAVAASPEYEAAFRAIAGAGGVPTPEDLAAAEDEAAEGESALQEDETEPARGVLANWSGEVRGGGAFLTGNTESQVVTFGAETHKETERWAFDLATDGRFESRGGEEVANRFAGAVDVARDLSAHWRAVGYVRGERDRFSGFDYRASTGVGLEWAVFRRDNLRWALLAGPGVRFDGAEIETVAPDGAIVDDTDLRVQPIVRGSSDFDWTITDRISFVQDVNVLAGQTTQIDVMSAFDISLIGRLSLRLGSNVRARPAPPAGAEPVDTETLIELKYEFGGP